MTRNSTAGGLDVASDQCSPLDETERIRSLFRYLRVADVSDALDGIGYFDLCLVSPAIRPLFGGMRFWGTALTLRCVPARQPMWPLGDTQDIVNAHGLWFEQVGTVDLHDHIRPGHVVVTDTGGSAEVGLWGSSNALAAVAAGAVGIVTDGCCRDTAELALQRTPVCCRARGRTIIPGRIELVEVNATIGCGGVQVRSGDIVGCDDDGVVVVPAHVAQQVAIHARAVLLADMEGRRGLYARLGMPMDETVDVDTVRAYYDQL